MSVLDDFETFCAAAADAMDHAGNERMSWIAPWKRDAVRVAGFTDIAEINARRNELIRSFYLRRFGAVATRCLWSPTEDGESSDAWALLCMEILQPARLFVRRLEEDDKWWEVSMSEAPWFLAATAGSLRGLLERGEFTEVKVAVDPRLMGRVRDGSPPPVDDQGRI